MASRRLPFEVDTPVSGPRARAPIDLGAVQKAVLVTMRGVPFSGCEQTAKQRQANVYDLHKSFMVLETGLRINFGRGHARHLKLLEETGAAGAVAVEADEPATPADGDAGAAAGAEAVVEYDSIANQHLCDLLFMVTDGTARDLVTECDQDGRRALLRLRYEYRQGASDRSVDYLEDLLAKATISDGQSPAEKTRTIVAAHRSLQKVQPHRTEGMLQRTLLRAIHTPPYHVLHMTLKKEVLDGMVSTTSICHQIEQYWEDTKGRYGQGGLSAADSSALAFRQIREPPVCDVCEVGAKQWMRECPVVLEAKALMAQRAATAKVARSFWAGLNEEDEDGIVL